MAHNRASHNPYGARLDYTRCTLAFLSRADIFRSVAKKLELDLGRLCAGQPPGVTPAFGQHAAEAGSVLFERNGHSSGVVMEVIGSRKKRFVVRWPTIHADAKSSHADLPEAAHYGAYGIAFLLTTELTGFKVIERSYKGTGFDYWLGTGNKQPFQKAARLEVSGIVNGADKIEARVKQNQTDRSAGSLPAYVAVIEFGKPISVFKRR